MRIKFDAPAVTLAVLGAISLPLTGCGNALIYGEGTNFSLTTLRLNDDPATPVRVISGLDRSAAAVVPKLGKTQDAVNMSADFYLDHPKGDGFFTAYGDTLKITTEFSAGDAALASPESTDGQKTEQTGSTPPPPAASGPSEVATQILMQ